MTIREEKQECRMRILIEVIEENGTKPIALGELTKKFNDKIPNNIYKLAPLELSSLLKQLKEYQRYTGKQTPKKYIFIKWRRPQRKCRHCGKICDGKICRNCFSRKHTGSVSRAISRRKNGTI